jgi:leucyl-tRNA synthetase
MSKHLGNVVDPNELVVHVGADTVRLAVLQAASPGRIFNWNDQPIRYCQMFLKKLYSYAEPRLRAWAAAQEGANDVARTRQPRIELGDKRRRRLVNWCATALGKVTADFERLEMQRAAHNAMLLLTRIQDFEERAGERREKLREQDSEAVAAALLLLVQMLAPLTPHIAEELWSLAGNATLLAAAPWPEEVATEEASEQEGRPEGSATAQVPAQEEATM